MPTRDNGPSSENEIVMFMHCGKCVKEWQQRAPEAVGESPKSYAQLAVGWTKKGLQVWCNRHECNIMNVDFQGQKFPANTTRGIDKNDRN